MVDHEKADRFTDLVWQIVDEAIEFSQENGQKIPETMSLYDHFVKRAKEMFPEQHEDQNLLLSMSQMWGAYIGHSVDRQSLRFAWMEKCCVGGTFSELNSMMRDLRPSQSDANRTMCGR